jgi:tetratricopeptide (TPR) repeat protein
VVLGLVLLSLAVFAPVMDNDFVGLDDDAYVTGNAHVRAGLTREGLAWAFTTFGYQGNWHPLTWLSHQLDAQLFGLDPRGHHATSLALHAANTALLFLLLCELTGATWPSALVAALFCVHPLHVETVAWVSDRKGLLSTLFWLLATRAWVRHLRAPAARGRLAAAALFAAALLAKPMPVTLPLTLLVLDVWPLGRAGRGGGPAASLRRAAPRLVAEKAPLFALSLAAAAAAWLAQRRGGALVFSGLEHGWVRVADAVVACAAYLGKLVRPVQLSVLYPLPQAYHAPARIAAAAALLAGVSAAAVLLRRRAPALAAGWAWFLVTLLPVSGLVQVGTQLMADRYTYVPAIGIFVAAAWGVPALAPPPVRRAALPAAAVAAVALLAALARPQIAVWRDSGTLFAHALEVAPGSWLLHTNLGRHLLAQGRTDDAIAHFSAALASNPAALEAGYDLGIALSEQGRLDEAAAAFRRVVRADPGYSAAHNNLGVVLMRQGRVREAVASFAAAVRTGPGNAAARANLAVARERLARLEQPGGR